MIDAAQAMLLVTSEEQGDATVRAAVIHYANAASAVAKRDQLLSEQHQAKWRAVARELRGQAGRNPILPHQLAHRGRGTNPGQLGAFKCRCHRVLLLHPLEHPYALLDGISAAEIVAPRFRRAAPGRA